MHLSDNQDLTTKLKDVIHVKILLFFQHLTETAALVQLCLASSCTLGEGDSLHIILMRLMMPYFFESDCGDYSDYDLGSSLMEFPKLVKAALSCSTLKSAVHANIPFTVSRNAVPPNLEWVVY